MSLYNNTAYSKTPEEEKGVLDDPSVTENSRECLPKGIIRIRVAKSMPDKL